MRPQTSDAGVASIRFGSEFDHATKGVFAGIGEVELGLQLGNLRLQLLTFLSGCGLQLRAQGFKFAPGILRLLVELVLQLEERAVVRRVGGFFWISVGVVCLGDGIGFGAGEVKRQAHNLICHLAIVGTDSYDIPIDRDLLPRTDGAIPVDSLVEELNDFGRVGQRGSVLWSCKRTCARNDARQ